MNISWKKKNKNLKPAVILDSIEAIRTVSPEGRISFSGFELDDALPALQSMLEFPPAAIDVDKSVLVWKTLSSITTRLTPEAFESAINAVFTAQNATRDSDYHILTSISFNPNGLSRRITIDGSTIKLLGAEFPRKYDSRIDAIARAEIPVDPTPKGYTRVVIHVRAKNPYGAVTKALRTIDREAATRERLARSRNPSGLLTEVVNMPKYPFQSGAQSGLPLRFGQEVQEVLRRGTNITLNVSHHRLLAP